MRKIIQWTIWCICCKLNWLEPQNLWHCSLICKSHVSSMWWSIFVSHFRQQFMAWLKKFQIPVLLKKLQRILLMCCTLQNKVTNKPEKQEIKWFSHDYSLAELSIPSFAAWFSKCQKYFQALWSAYFKKKSWHTVLARL